MRPVLMVVACLLIIPVAQAGEIPPGPFQAEKCIECHTQQNPDLVADWRKGPHGSGAKITQCTACHGNRHEGSAARARKNTACVACHGGSKSTVVRSYLTSKHGVIAKLEGAGWNWNLPLADANYRAPTCAYCHMHEAAHGLPANDGDVTASCGDCHSPTYAETLQEAGKRSLEVGALKLREAEAAVQSFRASTTLSETDVAKLTAMLAQMRKGSLASLRLGLGHHSPDYQWWYGQAALDGDLIRIKAFLTRLNRAAGAKMDGQGTPETAN